tara:strand:- start:151 stop:1086 length:936 start_codon:yes stop_codon:yes gene_type:complete
MKLLITGGTGTIGKEIINLALKDGVDVNVLTRDKNLNSKRKGLKYFFWNPEKEIIDYKCFDEIDTVINLAGFNVFNYWTKKNKSKILNSRLKSTEFILDEINKKKIKLRSFISASGIQAYKNSYSNYYTENDSESDKNSFLNKVVVNWEAKVLEYERIMPFTSFSIMRVGLILSNEGGLYKVSKKLARFYLLSPIGNGKQWQSWIHVNDAARAFIRCSKEYWKGTYNLVTPNPVTQKMMLKSIAKSVNRKIVIPNIPIKLAYLLLGEVTQILNSSQKVKPLMLSQKNFKYNFSNLDQAITNLRSRLYDNMA